MPLRWTLASFPLQFTAPLQSVWAAVHQRKQNAKVILHLHKWDADYQLANNTNQRMASDSCVLSEDLLIPTQSIWECTVVSHFQRCEIIDLVQNVIGCWPFFCCWVHCHRRNTHKHDGHKPAQVCCTCMWPRDLHQIENEEHDIILI